MSTIPFGLKIDSKCKKWVVEWPKVGAGQGWWVREGRVGLGDVSFGEVMWGWVGWGCVG